MNTRLLLLLGPGPDDRSPLCYTPYTTINMYNHLWDPERATEILMILVLFIVFF